MSVLGTSSWPEGQTRSAVAVAWHAAETEADMAWNPHATNARSRDHEDLYTTELTELFAVGSPC